MKQKEMANNLPLPPDNSIYTMIEVVAVCATFLFTVFKWIDSYFKNIKESKQEFIQNVVVATVKATLESELKGIKENIDKLFEYRESDRVHFDGKVDTIIKEIRKP